jgi:hypothetical protein
MKEEKDFGTLRKDWVEVVENPDGSATLHLEINPEIRGLILRTTGKKRLTKKLVESFVLDSLYRHLEFLDP